MNHNNSLSKFYAFVLAVLVILLVVLGMTIYEANELAQLIKELLPIIRGVRASCP